MTAGIDWLQFWDTISVLQVVGWILGILGILAFLIKGWPRVKQFVAFVDALLSLPDFIARTDKTLKLQDVKIEEIHHEVNYNNGSSVKDAVSRVETGVASLHEKVDATRIALEAEDARLRKDLEDTREPIKRVRKPKPPTPKEQP